MERIRNILPEILYPAILWTGIYVATIYLLLWFMFGFDALNLLHWARVPSVHLTGLAGLTFGVLMIGTVPIYFATLHWIIKNKKIFPIPFTPNKKNDDKKDKEKDTSADTNIDTKNDILLPPTLPYELTELYIRATKNQGPGIRNQESVIKVVEPEISNPEKKQEPTTNISEQEVKDIKDTTHQSSIINPQSPAPAAAAAPINSDPAFPIPDFDTEIDDAPTSSGGAPMFKSLDFTPKFEDVAQKSEINIIERDGKKFAIATHDDSDFWIADDDEWNATGKTKPSPVKKLLEIKDATPVLLLSEKNIMDLDARISDWEKLSVKIIFNIDEL